MSQPRGSQATDQPKRLTDLAFYLALKHQEAQQSIANETAAGLALLWPLLRFDRLDETTPGWLHATTLQVERQYRKSEQAAYEYVQGAKWAVEPLTDPLEKVDLEFPTADVQIAMRATGPVAVKKATALAFTAPQGDPQALSDGTAPNLRPVVDLDFLAAKLMDGAKLASTGVGVKEALNGGRGEVQQLVAEDAVDRLSSGEVIGWARFTEDSATGPCYFCAMLASRGAVYLSDGSFDQSNRKIREINKWRKERRAFVGDGVAKVHDHCKCSLRPVYSEDDSLDERGRNFLAQWEAAPGGLKEFRRVYVRPAPYPEKPLVDLAAVRENRRIVADRLGEAAPQVGWLDEQVAAISG